MQKRFPNTPDELIAELDRIFPELAITAETTMDEIKYKAGQRSVIQFAKTWRAAASRDPVAPRKRGEGRKRASR